MTTATTDPPLVLHPSLRILLRRMRPILWLALGSILVGWFMAIAFSMFAPPSSHERSFLHRFLALMSAYTLYVMIAAVMLRALAVRAGAWATPGAAGLVSLKGTIIRPSLPVVRFLDVNAVNPLGIGSLRRLPVTYGMNAAGQRVLALSPTVNEERDIAEFIRVTGLPVDRHGGDGIDVFTLRRRLPMSPELRRQTWLGFKIAVPLVVAGIASIAVVALLIN